MACIVDGLPADRPRCEQCRRPLAYWSTDLETQRVETGKKYFDGSDETRRVVTRKRFERWKGYPVGFVRPFFCRLSCALDFATNAVEERQ